MAGRLILLNKPFNVLCQFSADGSTKQTLAEFLPVPGVYPAGRLDYDSEGLLLLTDAGWLQHRIANPSAKMTKTYWAQVEGEPAEDAIMRLARGLVLNDGPTLPAEAHRIEEPPALWPRVPPIRARQSIPTAWLTITLREGRNRQVRRMTAAIGHPTLRLIRAQIGEWTLDGLPPGEWREAPMPAK